MSDNQCSSMTSLPCSDAPKAAETALVPRLSSQLATVIPTVNFLSRLARTTWLADPFRSRQPAINL